MSPGCATCGAPFPVATILSPQTSLPSPQVSPLETAFRARVRRDLRLPPDAPLAERVRANAVRDELHARMAATCAPADPDTDVVAISKSSLRRLLLGETRLDKANANTRDAVARYLGHADADAFDRTQPRTPQQEPPPGPQAPPQSQTPPRPEARPPHRLLAYALTAVAVLLAANLAYFGLSSAGDGVAGAPDAHRPDDPALAARLHDLIRAHNRAEFALYRAVPDLADTAALRATAWPDGGAYRYIRRVATRHARRGNRLNRERSSRQLVDCRVRSCTDSSCLVETTEQWTLIWDQPDGSTLAYDVVNDQRYGLRERDGTWKIYANGYAGTSTVVEAEAGVGTRGE